MAATEKTAKQDYQEAMEASLHQPVAKIISESVMTVLMNATMSNSYADLTSQIAEASKKGDVDLIIKLSTDLKNVKDNRSSHEKTFKQLQDKYDFADVLQAFKPEFEELAYAAAYKALTTAQTSIKQSGKAGGTKPAKPTGDDAKRHQTIYKITKGDESAIFPIRMGRASVNLKQDEEAFNLLGFKVEKEDNKDVLNPGTIKQADGTEELATRKSIVAAIQAKLKGFEDFTVADISEPK